MLAHAGDIDGGIRRLEQLLHEQFARRGPHDLLVQTIWRELGSLRGPEYERAVLRRILADQTSVRGEDDDETRSTRDRLDTVERETTTGSD
jgi:hypothetical protein